MFRIDSPAFDPDGLLPSVFTCDGVGRSPPLDWEDIPSGTVSLALLVDDPDAPDPAAPKRVWLHWLLYNIPPEPSHLVEGVGNSAPTGGARTGLNDGGTTGYQPPCPPVGRHRYFFRLYALDTTLPDLGPRARRADLEEAMAGHILATATLMGSYAHPGNG